eukprot:3791765-Pleurochrysis_carterae.AAC.1
MLNLVGGTLRTWRPASAPYIRTPNGRTANGRRPACDSHPWKRNNQQLRARSNGSSQAGWQFHF